MSYRRYPPQLRRRVWIAIAIGVAIAIVFVVVTEVSSAYSPAVERQQARARHAICKTFGPYCGEALRVSWCESRHYRWASNGQYLGLFQMGSFARSRFGHGSGAWAQARAARRYFIASGRDWSPWSCRP